MSPFDQIKRFAPLITIAVIGIILFFSLKDDDFLDDDVADDLELVKSTELSFDNEVEDMKDHDSTGENDIEVIVDIKGEVNKPGVYELQTGDRVQTVIERAGGFTENADEQQINLAQKVHDEMIIYVPKVGEIEEPLPPLPQSSRSGAVNDGSSDLIRVNSATEEELTKLQGIGPSKAQAIINYRDEHGPFQQAEDLLEVNGIGEKTFENIRDHIIVP